MFALIENGAVKRYPYSLHEIKLANLNTSFPVTVSDETMAEYGAMRVYFATPPVLSDTQVLVEDTPVFDVDAQRWTQVWQVREMTTEEVTQRFDNVASAVRQQRDNKLAETDWRFRSDLTPSQAWIDYCQALRDIPTQSGFPWTVTWPTEP
jgi:hypothetical protein